MNAILTTCKKIVPRLLPALLILAALLAGTHTYAACHAKFSYTVSGNTVYFADSSTSGLKSLRYKWKFGDGDSSTLFNPTHTYATLKHDSTYHVCVTVIDTAAKCSATYCDNITIKVKSCNAGFTYSTSGRSISFTNTSTAAHGYTSKWKFGDGDSSTSRNPIHVYGYDTTFYVCLTITDSTKSCTSTYCASIKVVGGCHASFTDVDSNKLVRFTNTSSAVNSYTSYWTFGDGTTSTDRNPHHTYSSDGSYAVCLTITDSAKHCSSTYCTKVYVYTCTAGFTYTVSGRTVTFHNTSSSASGTYTCAWSLGDGTGSTDINPTHPYSGKDTLFKVCLYMKDASGLCGATYCATIKVPYTGSCHASFSSWLSGKTLSFANTSSTTNGFKSKWHFGDGDSSDASNPSHTYSKDSVYHVCLKVTDSSGKCSDTYCADLAVKQCTTDFSYSVSGMSVTLANASTSPYGFTSEWDFGDGTISDTKNPTHTFSKAGTYTVCLKTWDSVAHCGNGYCTKIIVPHCHASFSYSTSGKTLSLTDKSSTLGTALRSEWHFGDNDSSDAKNPTHTYSKDSMYHVCLKVKDTFTGCTADTCAYITIKTKFKIAGRVTADSNLAYPGTAWLIQYDSTDSTLTAIKTAPLQKDSVGAYYVFTNLDAGIYYTKAALDSTCTVYSSYVPTYHEKALFWADADDITLTTADIANAPIHMKKGSNTSGSGFISGKISQGANKKGDPIAGVEIILLNMQNVPLAYTYSGTDGTYRFNNLPNGTYQVYAEVLGVPTDAIIVTLGDDNNNKKENVDIAVTAMHVRAVAGISEAPLLSADKVEVYPNPVRDALNIRINVQNAQQVSITVYDISGRVLSQTSTQLLSGEQTLQINTQALNKGMYLLRMHMSKDGQQLQTPFIKAD